ncbi:hypothetical protein ACLI4R_07245 [Natrialbaceae archaeon A-chndr2]|uniref:hypothetical protein n=1 Tax=Natronosalvus amylolyticus TaxID=2961994 RepID=UPI0020C9CF71|nr:hypothetical protein [Natronosalvus amylolyticus]
MDTLLLVSLVAIPVFVQVLLAAFVHYDATDVGMKNPNRWTAIVFFVPIYGVIVYILARSELSYDPETDPYKGGKVNVHPSRADEVPWDVRDGDGADGENEWNDPVDIDDLEADEERERNG